MEEIFNNYLSNALNCGRKQIEVNVIKNERCSCAYSVGNWASTRGCGRAMIWDKFVGCRREQEELGGRRVGLCELWHSMEILGQDYGVENGERAA